MVKHGITWYHLHTSHFEVMHTLQITPGSDTLYYSEPYKLKNCCHNTFLYFAY